jgi:hypothetical protein
MNIDLNLFSQIAEKVFSAPLSKTPNLGLGKYMFKTDGREIIALQQNPGTKSEWAKLSQDHKVVQFKDLSSGKYIAVAVDGKVKSY